MTGEKEATKYELFEINELKSTENSILSRKRNELFFKLKKS